MFQGQIVWRGIVYTILMIFGKTVTGIWLIQLHFSPPQALQKMGRISKTPFASCFQPRKSTSKQTGQTPYTKTKNATKGTTPKKSTNKEPNRQQEGHYDSQDQPAATSPIQESQHANTTPNTSSLPRKPRSLYPASILGLAMVARGEIGYLIASLAETDGVFSSSSGMDTGGSSELYLVVVWAITLCTILGPVCVGTLVKRVKKLQERQRIASVSGAGTGAGGQDPLGSWGVTS